MAAGWSAANKAAGKIMTIPQLRIFKYKGLIIFRFLEPKLWTDGYTEGPRLQWCQSRRDSLVVNSKFCEPFHPNRTLLSCCQSMPFALGTPFSVENSFAICCTFRRGG